MAVVSLTNIGNGMITLELSHSDAPKHARNYFQQSTGKAGKKGIRRIRLSVPESLIIPAGQTRDGLPGWIAEIPRVHRLVAAKKLAVEVKD